ncbi:gamma-glutamyltransferase family protein [Croceicoccus sp. BE223]|uniref:gamma-glutamyltransferase family protein n=1 Tax=Croceicoccus sp. BE223 TaxID=2817716 RepID=UPI0028562D8E|nr:gamma-glutamyltransferase family protein [Croceicoccus sp. BE223]MDR7102251.1 gamma-glutamyltranspeptidase/glutathione hydrolase [Croceicoccus sp. BE223]
MMKRFLAVLAPLAMGACATVPATHPATSSDAKSSPGMVSAADPRAAEAGAAMLRSGGNATDAAIATMLALSVVEPQSSGIGGGGFLVLDPEGDGDPTSYDGRETAPAAAGPDWFLDAQGQPIGFRTAVESSLSVGVPGNIMLAAKAHADHGALPWESLFTPAIALAEQGFAVTPRLHASLRENRSTGGRTDASRALFYGADGEPVPVGTLVRNAALGRFLRRLAAEGPQAFQTGENAVAIVRAVEGDMPARAVPPAATNVPLIRMPTAMTTDDVAGYSAKERPSPCGTYRVYLICGMGPPSSGATTVYAIVKQLERFDMASHGPQDPVAWHLIAESMRLAYADRGRYLADSDFVPVNVTALMDGAYLRERGRLISPGSTMAKAEPGDIPLPVALGHSAPQPEHGTSHFVTVDGKGGVASYTSTVEGAFGSGLMVNGYYLNNELTDFDFAPVDKAGRPVANRVEGGKRPRSSMSPTIVYGPDGTMRLAIGAAGGATIIAQVAKAIVGVIDWGLTAQAAIDLPVIFAPGDTVWLERGTSLEAMAPALRALGHADVRVREPGFKANAIERVGGQLRGAADHRSEGASASE